MNIKCHLFRLIIWFSIAIFSGGCYAESKAITSYENFKRSQIPSTLLPEDLRDPMYAFLHANDDGKKDLIWAKPKNRVPSNNVVDLLFFLQKEGDKGLFGQDPDKVLRSPCLPRKLVVGDFNEDGQDDIFLACNGIDVPPFPESLSFILLSDGHYNYGQRKIEAIPRGNFHSAASGDIDGDGHLDIIVADQEKGLTIVYGDGAGGFIRKTNPLGSELFQKGVLTIELVDVNNDGVPDLLVGRGSPSGAQFIVYENRAGNFKKTHSVISKSRYKNILDVLSLELSYITLNASEDYRSFAIIRYSKDLLIEKKLIEADYDSSRWAMVLQEFDGGVHLVDGMDQTSIDIENLK
jgi:FG-GAP-like repeat